MRSLLLTCFSAASLLAVLGASPSEAIPIGPDCGTCQGSIYDLSYGPIPVSTTATTETWRIVYSIDTAGYDGAGEFINTVAFKASSEFVTASLISAPGDFANWVEMSGGLNAAGCSGSGSGFDCVAFRAAVSLAPSVPGGTYTWVFDVEVASASLFTGTDEASVKARYVTDTGSKAGALVSESITLSTYSTPSVPEPASASLLAAAAAGFELARRRAGPAPS
jgi:hypothetical protein